MTNEIDIHVKGSEFRFSKNAIVVLPMYIRRQTSGSVVKGIIQGDTPYYFEGSYYWPVKIKRPALPRYRKVSSEAEILFVKEDDLRLDVEHPECPSCQCLTEEAQQAILEEAFTDNDDEEDDELDELEEGEEDEEEPFRT